MGNKKSLLAAVVLLVIVGAGLGFKEYFDYQKTAKFKFYIENANALVDDGDTKNAIPFFEEAIKNATIGQNEAWAKMFLGSAHLTNDPQKGIAILKEISLNASIPAFIKASAINSILNYFYYDFPDSKKNLEFAKKYVFVGERWFEFAAHGLNSRADLELAMRNGFEWSLKTYPTFEAAYGVALWYGDQLKHGDVSGEEANRYGDIILTKIANGDASFKESYSTRRKAIIAFEYIIKGLAVEGLAVIDKIRPEEVEKIYQTAIDMLETDSANNFERDEALYARLHMASFLSRTNPKASREKILNLLAPIYKMEGTSFFRFLTIAADASRFDDDHLREGIVRVAKIDKSFQKLLLSLGWKTTDFK